MKSLKGYDSTAVSLTPDQYTAAGNGNGVDLLGYESALVVVSTGGFGGTTPAASYTIQESVDNVNFTNVADSNLDGVTGNGAGVALAATSTVQVGYLGRARFLRVILASVTGTTPIIRAVGAIVRQRAHTLPTP